MSKKNAQKAPCKPVVPKSGKTERQAPKRPSAAISGHFSAILATDPHPAIANLVATYAGAAPSRSFDQPVLVTTVADINARLSKLDDLQFEIERSAMRARPPPRRR